MQHIQSTKVWTEAAIFIFHLKGYDRTPVSKLKQIKRAIQSMAHFDITDAILCLAGVLTRGRTEGEFDAKKSTGLEMG